MTLPQLAPLILRLALGLAACFHALRFLGAFTRDSAQDRVAELVAKVGAAGFQQPTVLAWATVVALALGGVGLVLGAFTRVACGLVGGVCLLGLLVRPPVWEVNGLAEADRLGLELLLAFMVISAAVFCLGPGTPSVDGHLAQRRAHAA